MEGASLKKLMALVQKIMCWKWQVPVVLKDSLIYFALQKHLYTHICKDTHKNNYTKRSFCAVLGQQTI